MNAKIVGWWLSAWVTLAVPLAVFGASSAPQVKTVSGIVEGKQYGAVDVFLGIPYAAPPIGELRWKPPAAATKWGGVRKATEFGSHCMQGKVYGDMNFRDAGARALITQLKTIDVPVDVSKKVLESSLREQAGR